MKVHYINILLFTLPLNILAHNKNKQFITLPTPHTQNSRLLCECELYMPNYDNDPQMKKVMENFSKQTEERFHEYDERMKNTRQKCKEQCDKEIQKIILKDKLEKELMDKFATLQTDMQNDAIPTCVCEKSLADKVEKGCLRCGGILGAGVVPGVGILGGIGEAAMSAWKVAALKYAIVAAKEAGTAEGLAAGNAHAMNMIMVHLKQWGVKDFCADLFDSFVTKNLYTELASIGNAIIERHEAMCAIKTINDGGSMCEKFGRQLGTHAANLPRSHPTRYFVGRKIGGLAGKADQAAKTVAKDTAKKVTADLTAEKTVVIDATYGAWKTTITASIIAVVVIVLIMVIIYLILRHRRKKKMKKKLQYIKLLEE
ncbi:rifin PIR protein, putative [Plasmodium reichenowi]|uniref:Rifin PIR protein, putative n=1 Tax=Plasmodium reichenowi TaxID=5854 RepID=A0A2P9DSF3_PLARE|nr:rifin PIR protein, putative [Plasmodium reichenowi]